MIPRPPASPVTAPRHRWVALLGVTMVLWLNVLAVCAGAHEWMHTGHDDHGEAVCAVTQFALGGAESLATPDFSVAPVPGDVLGLVSAVSAPLVAPAHCLPPGCGPPRV